MYGALVPGRVELPRLSTVKSVIFTDPAGGSGGDSYTLGVAHREPNGRVVLDCIREQRPPFSPEETTREFAQVAKAYGVTEVTGDKYAGEWPREQA